MKVEKGDHSRVLLPETKSPIQRMAPVILSGWTLLSAIYFLNVRRRTCCLYRNIVIFTLF